MKAKRQICKAVSELLCEVAFMPDEIPDEYSGLVTPILLDIENAKAGVGIIMRNKEKFNEAD